MKNSSSTKGARIFPSLAKPTARAQARIRKMPQKKVSPIPDSGPIRDTLMALMEATSKVLSRLAFSSMAMVVPMTKGEGATVMLKAAIWRCIAAFNASSSPL